MGRVSAKLNFLTFLGRPETVVKCISMIYDILDKVPPKGSEQRYDPNMFDPNYDYGGKSRFFIPKKPTF